MANIFIVFHKTTVNLEFYMQLNCHSCDSKIKYSHIYNTECSLSTNILWLNHFCIFHWKEKWKMKEIGDRRSYTGYSKMNKIIKHTW